VKKGSPLCLDVVLEGFMRLPDDDEVEVEEASECE